MYMLKLLAEVDASAVDLTPNELQMLSLLRSKYGEPDLSLVKTQSAVEIQCFHLFSEIPLQQYAYSYCAVACRQFDGQRWRMRF